MSIFSKIKNFGKKSYAQIVRESAIKSLTSGQKMSGKMRRSLLRSTALVVAVGDGKDPVKVKAKVTRKIAAATHEQRCRWFSRLPRRIAVIDEKLQAAVAAKMTMAVKALSDHRLKLDFIRGEIGAFFANQAFAIEQIQKQKQQ